MSIHMNDDCCLRLPSSANLIVTYMCIQFGFLFSSNLRELKKKNKEDSMVINTTNT